jgi:hypothetical protein
MSSDKVERPDRSREGDDMGTSIAAVALRARCPLCGSPVLSIGPQGHVLDEDLHPIPLGDDFGRGYTVCDDCAVLANLPSSLTLN